jgi:hypothetical protein
MRRYRFSLQRMLWQSQRGKHVEKVVVIEATDLVQARQLIYKMYPDWDVSMFWPM